MLNFQGIAMILLGVVAVVKAAGLANGYVRPPAVYQEKDRAKIANCRAVCLDTFRKSKDLGDEWCYQTPNCNMCWHVCEMLLVEYRVWSPMCGVQDICFPGCVTACDYQQHGSPGGNFQRSPNPVPIPNSFRVTQGEEPEPVLEAEWTEPKCGNCQNGSLVYILSRQKRSDHSWVEVKQTSDLKTELRESLWNSSTQFKIIAVSASGVEAEGYVTHEVVTTTDNSLQRDASSSGATPTTNFNHQYVLSPSWTPRLVSMEKASQSSGIEALIAWPPAKKSCRKYEVAWRVLDQSMEVTGHLYTFTHLASLALWPNSLHSVDVVCFDSEGKISQRSEALFINSKDAKVKETTMLVPGVNGGQCLDLTYWIMVVGIAGSLFLAFFAFFVIWICLRMKRRWPRTLVVDNATTGPPSSPINKQVLKGLVSSETANAFINRHQKLVKTISRKLSSISDSKESAAGYIQVDLLDDDDVFNEHQRHFNNNSDN